MCPTNEVQIMPITTPMELQEWDQFATRSSVGHMQQCRWWANPLKETGVSFSYSRVLEGPNSNRRGAFFGPFRSHF